MWNTLAAERDRVGSICTVLSVLDVSVLFGRGGGDVDESDGEGEGEGCDTPRETTPSGTTGGTVFERLSVDAEWCECNVEPRRSLSSSPVFLGRRE